MSSSTSNAQTLRQLAIKTNVVKRLAKEETSDIKESEDRKSDLEKMKVSEADGADIRNAERVLKDAEQMIPRTKANLDKAVEELEDLVNALGSDEEVKGSTEWQNAFSQLQQIEAARKADGN